MMDMLDSNSMLLVDNSSLCSGPKYTFSVKSVGESILTISQFQSYLWKKSSYLVQKITIDQAAIKYSEVSSTNIHIGWSKLNICEIKTKYTLPVNREIAHTIEQYKQMYKITDKDIDILLQSIVQTVHKHSYTLQRNKYFKGLKAYWTSNLNILNKSQRSLA